MVISLFPCVPANATVVLHCKHSANQCTSEHHSTIQFNSYYCIIPNISYSYTTTTPVKDPLSWTIWRSQYQKGKTNLDLLEQEIVSGSGISWTICKSAPRSRQITTPEPNHSDFYKLDALPVAQPTMSKHWKKTAIYILDLKRMFVK